MKTKSGIKLALIILAIAILSYIALNGLQIGVYDVLPVAKGVNLGLDLRGGLYAIYEAQVDPDDEDKDLKIEGAINVIRNRLDAENQEEATIARQGTDRIRVEIPGVDDPKELANILSKPAVLEFVDPNGNIIMGGEDVKKAEPSYYESRPVVSFKLTPEGTKKFADATTEFNGQVIEILLDKKAISSPRVNQPILSGEGIIEGGNMTEDSAKQLANLIESGALPVPLEQMEVRTIGATLGANALDKGILAGLIGISAILIFMLVYYRLQGIVADLALVLYLIIVFYVLVLAEVTLTLPGIAGIILSVGMAVDANVIIFERIKEEIRTGKSLYTSVNSGFSKAFRAILDANVTTIIAAIVLWVYGTGPIQGFAKTLFIGIAVSMLTAVVFTKHVMRLLMNLRIRNLKLYGLRGGTSE